MKFNSIFDIFQSLNISLLSFLICFVLLWLFVMGVVIKAKRNRLENRPAVVQYDIPEVSPVLARYILVSGKEGGRAGEISKSGVQRILMIDLYENGALKELNFTDDITIEYEINPNYKNLNLKEEQMVFLDLLQQKVGLKNTISELTDVKGYSSDNGFEKIDQFWFSYWQQDLRKICVNNGYFNNTTGVISTASGLLAASMTLGIFFSIFFLFIPFVGLIIVSIILLPIIILFGVSILLEKLILLFVGSNFPVIPFQAVSPFFFIITFLSWFAWIYILSQNQNIAFTPINQKGKDLVWKLNGYKAFLKKVDVNRISFSLDRDLDFKRNNTTFAWLAIFSLANDKHWDNFMEVHSKKTIDILPRNNI